MNGFGYRRHYSRGYDFLGIMEITKREVLVSIVIIGLMLILGMALSNEIFMQHTDDMETYNKALKVDTVEMFQYGMKTNVGNAFVYGELKAVDTVTYPEIGGNYMYVEKTREEYTRHTRIVTYQDSNGNTKTRTETYYSWDEVSNEEQRCREVTFCGTTFSSYKFKLPTPTYITTKKVSSDVRYVYEGVFAQYKGTVFTDLRDNTISTYSEFYANKTIEQTLEYLETVQLIFKAAFWVVWVILIGVIVFFFFKAENEWLGDDYDV